jgi:hypothetical protein
MLQSHFDLRARHERQAPRPDAVAPDAVPRAQACNLDTVLQSSSQTSCQTCGRGSQPCHGFREITVFSRQVSDEKSNLDRAVASSVWT